MPQNLKSSILLRQKCIVEWLCPFSVAFWKVHVCLRGVKVLLSLRSLNFYVLVLTFVHRVKFFGLTWLNFHSKLPSSHPPAIFIFFVISFPQYPFSNSTSFALLFTTFTPHKSKKFELKFIFQKILFQNFLVNGQYQKMQLKLLLHFKLFGRLYLLLNEFFAHILVQLKLSAIFWFWETGIIAKPEDINSFSHFRSASKFKVFYFAEKKMYRWMALSIFSCLLKGARVLERRKSFIITSVIKFLRIGVNICSSREKFFGLTWLNFHSKLSSSHLPAIFIFFVISFPQYPFSNSTSFALLFTTFTPHKSKKFELKFNFQKILFQNFLVNGQYQKMQLKLLLHFKLFGRLYLLLNEFFAHILVQLKLSAIFWFWETGIIVKPEYIKSISNFRSASKFKVFYFAEKKMYRWMALSIFSCLLKGARVLERRKSFIITSVTKFLRIGVNICSSREKFFGLTWLNFHSKLPSSHLPAIFIFFVISFPQYPVSNSTSFALLFTTFTPHKSKKFELKFNFQKILSKIF